MMTSQKTSKVCDFSARNFPVKLLPFPQSFYVYGQMPTTHLLSTKLEKLA